MPKLILASSSHYRKALLQRLGIPFETIAPFIDESRLDDETPAQLVKRLARLKAEAAGMDIPDALIIGSDQCAVIDGHLIGKPGNFERAFLQLKKACGNVVEFHTGLCLLDTSCNRYQLDEITFRVHLRDLSDEQLKRYLNREKPFDCAGSFKAEGLGIALFTRMEGDDPNALVGLPMIRLVSMLEQAGMSVI
jgi:septum formation protein